LSEKGNVKDLAIMYNTTKDEANNLADRIAPLYPREKIIMGEIGPILGSHAGPNLLVACYRGKSRSIDDIRKTQHIIKKQKGR